MRRLKNPDVEFVLRKAQNDAWIDGDKYIRSEHLFIAAIYDHGEERGAAQLLQSLGVSLKELKKQTSAEHRRRIRHPYWDDPRPSKLTRQALKALELSIYESLMIGHNFVGTEHILLGLLRMDCGLPTRVMKTFNVDYERAYRQFVRLTAIRDRTQSPRR